MFVQNAFENEVGLTRFATSLPKNRNELKDELERLGIPYEEFQVDAIEPAGAATLFLYERPDGTPTAVLKVTEIERQPWQTEDCVFDRYLYFDGVTRDDALSDECDWLTVYEWSVEFLREQWNAEVEMSAWDE